MSTAIQIGHSTRPGAMGAVRGTKAPLGLGLCAQSAPKVRPQHPTPRRAPKKDLTRSPLPPCPALPWPFSSSPDHDHPAGNLPTTADLLAVTLTGIDNSSPFASVLTLRLADSVPAPGLPRTLRMSVSASQAALLTAAAGWDGDGARHHQAGSAAPSAAAAQPSALDTTAGIMAVLDATLAAAVVWSFDGEVFGAGLCVSPKNSGPGGGGLFKKTVPAKPSDALILALQAGAPIYVTHAVWVAVALPAGGGGAEEGGGPGEADQAAPWAAAAARAAHGTPPPLPPALARILDQLAAADALLHGRHASTTPQPPPWSLSGSVNRLGAAAHAGLPTAAALAAAGRARAEAAAALAALAARPLAAARARAGMTLLKMQLAAADERFTDASAAAARLDRHVAGDPGMAAAVSLEAALDDGRLEDGVRLLGALLAHRGRLGEEGGVWESEEEGEEAAKGGGGGGGDVE